MQLKPILLSVTLPVLLLSSAAMPLVVSASDTTTYDPKTYAIEARAHFASRSAALKT